MLDRKIFAQMLREAVVEEVMKNSVINHHVNGMSYLCLHRSDKLTVKLYLVENPTNPHSGYLVHPHSHRYAFGSTVLHGALEHIRFKRDADGRLWREHFYNPDQRSLDRADLVGLKEQADYHSANHDSSYWVEPHEIHTLRMLEGLTTLIGLVQFGDVKRESELFLPDTAPMQRSDERRPTYDETAALMQRSRDLMGD